jgi:sporulation protein YlmC with PRC-barrel domain
MVISRSPKDLLYKPVVDASGEPVGKIVNLTQNGSGQFEIFGVAMNKEASIRMNHGHQNMGEPVFLDIDLIDAVDKVVTLKKRLEDLLVE